MRTEPCSILRSLTLALGLAFFAPYAAAESVVIVPESSRLALASYDGDSHDASFRGTERISGRFAIAWRNDGDEHLLEILFLPDASSMKRLPRERDEPGLAIAVTNRDAAVMRLLGRENGARLLEGELAAIEGSATLVIGDVETGVDDDGR